MTRSPAGPLIHEHRVIERAVAVLGTQVERVRVHGDVDFDTIKSLVDFIRSYADRCHHGKEEAILFALLAEKNLDSGLASAMSDLIADHVRGRALTGRLAEANERHRAGDPDALAELESAGQGLLDLYPTHIWKEDRRFFKPCLEYLSEQELARMVEDFDAFDRALIHEKYLGVVEALERAAL